MSYQVIARKWRPQFFIDLVGQEHVAKTLKNAILTNRIAHGYIFTGPRGVGKTSAARIYAKALNCNAVKDGEPCNICSSCLEITDGHNMDVIEIDGASNNSVDNIRDLRDNIRFTPNGNYKIYIIDEVHMLSKGAFNALLKTLEEPPAHAVFIFATTEIHKVLPTILSRCQRYDFKRIPVQKIVDRLSYICKEENISIDNGALIQIAKKADGGMRDSQSLLDQLISFCGTTIKNEDVMASFGILDYELFFQLLDFFAKKDAANVLLFVEKIFNDGYELSEFLNGLEEHLRHLLVCTQLKNADLIDNIDFYKLKYTDQAKLFSAKDILRLVEILQKVELSVKHGHHPKLKLELALSKMALMEKSIDLNELIESLKKKDFSELNSRSETHIAKPKIISTLLIDAYETKSLDKIKEIETSPTEEQNSDLIHKKNDSEKEIKSEKNIFSTTQLKEVWEKLLSKIRDENDSMYMTLFNAHFYLHSDNSITIAFDKTDNGRLHLNLFEQHKNKINQFFYQHTKQNYNFKTDQINFKEHSIVFEGTDLESVVNRIKEKDQIINNAINLFDLNAVKMDKI